MLDLETKTLCEFCFSELSGSTCAFCNPVSNTDLYATALKEGTVLAGKYAVGRVLGKGGFGITYLCYDIKNQRKVAIKEFLPSSLVGRNVGASSVYAINKEDSEALKNGSEKFYDEAKTISKFNGNEGIIGVFEFFYENNTAYYVMEYLDGCDMKTYIKSKGGKINTDEALYIINKVANALNLVHSSRVLHRDISPDNIFICNNGNVKLIDFGSARQVISEATNSMSVILKHGFAPPEQYNRNGNQGPWTDIYALGATLYFAITGKQVDDVMTRITGDTLDTRGMEPVLSSIIKKMLAVRSSDRFQSIPELKAALGNLNCHDAIPKDINTTPPIINEAPSKRVITQLPKSQTVLPQKAEKRNNLTLKLTIATLSVIVIGLSAVLIFMANKGESETTGSHYIPSTQTPPTYTPPSAKPSIIPHAPEKRVIASGNCGEALSWELLDDGVLTIYGNGEMGNYYNTSQPWENDKNKIKKVVLSEGVTSIGEHAFRKCEALETLVLPDSLKNIEKGAFYYCRALTNFTIPKGVSKIGQYAFVDTPKVTKMTVSPDNEYYTVFDGVLYSKDMTVLVFCPNGKTSVNIPHGVEIIGAYAFNECTKIKTIQLPDTVRIIENAAFCACDSLESLNIPESVEEIEEYAFSDSIGIKMIIIPSSVSSVHSYAFGSWTSSQHIYIEGTTDGWNKKWHESSDAEIHYS